MKDSIICPKCGYVLEKYRNPFPTVDIIIELNKDVSNPAKQDTEIVLIKRKNPPFGWALPGGFVDYGESLESAAIREAREETSLDVQLICQIGAYSDPARDPRFHTISVVFLASAAGLPVASDDAIDVGTFNPDEIPHNLVFDHARIIKDYLALRQKDLLTSCACNCRY